MQNYPACKELKVWCAGKVTEVINIGFLLQQMRENVHSVPRSFNSTILTLVLLNKDATPLLIFSQSDCLIWIVAIN